MQHMAVSNMLLTSRNIRMAQSCLIALCALHFGSSESLHIITRPESTVDYPTVHIRLVWDTQPQYRLSLLQRLLYQALQRILLLGLQRVWTRSVLPMFLIAPKNRARLPMHAGKSGCMMIKTKNTSPSGIKNLLLEEEEEEAIQDRIKLHSKVARMAVSDLRTQLGRLMVHTGPIHRDCIVPEEHSTTASIQLSTTVSIWAHHLYLGITHRHQLINQDQWYVISIDRNKNTILSYFCTNYLFRM